MSRALVISGGSKGIGLATSQLFLEQGYRVVSLSRSAHPFSEVKAISADLSDLNWLEHCAGDLLDCLDGVDVITLVHNAAILEKDTADNLDGASLQRVLQVNVVAAAQLNRLLIPRMQAGSSILYVGSTLSEKAVANSCSYVASKHAQLGLMRATCQDLGGRGIHTACICPGFTDTEMLRAHLGHDREILQSIVAQCSFRRLVEPGEIAATLLFCAGNPVINGALLHASLGQIEH